MSTIDQSDICLIINSNIRQEASILNIHLINRLKKGNFKIFYIGPKINFTYQIEHLGLSLKTFNNILIGKHFFCKKLKKAKNPFIIIGQNILHQKNGFILIENIKKLFFLEKKIHFLSTATSFIHFSELFIDNQLKSKKINFLYLYNTNIKKKRLNQKEFIVYQGHHFTEDAQQSNLVIPGLSFLEKKGTYINIEGQIQKNYKILNLKTEQREDFLIFKSMYQYILYKNQKTLLIKKFLTLNDLLPYLLKNQLKLNNFLSNKNKNEKIQSHPLNFFFKNNYSYTILEEYSKILIHSNKILLKNNYLNFN